MERTFKAKLYLLGYGDCANVNWDPIEEAERYESYNETYSNAYKMRFEDKGLDELRFFERRMKQSIEFFGYVRNPRYGTNILADWIRTIDDTKLKENLKIVRALINELCPKDSRVTRKEKRAARAKLNRSYGRGKNK